MLLLILLSFFTRQQLASSVGNFERKAMTLSQKVVSAAESSEDHSLQEQIAKMMAMVEASSQPVLVANKALEEARAEFTLKITELQRENQYLKEVQKKM